jgi:hypothetical protein
LGAFAAASFTSLLGALFVIIGHEGGRHTAMILALVCGAVGVASLVTGSMLLVWETRLALAILREETRMVRERLSLAPIRPVGEPAEADDDDAMGS